MRATSMRQHADSLSIALSLAAGTLGATGASAQSNYQLFESGPVRPIALSLDGTRLFAVNTPDGHLEIFDVAPDGTLARAGNVRVGMEPVAVAVENASRVWVVNHLSDSVSIVDVSGPQARVVRTLLVGDEPSDIVFAGPDAGRAFVTTAHRGQNHPVPRGDYEVAGQGRADVWVFDAANPGSSLGGDPITIVTLFGDRPRALAASPDGSTVYAAVFRSGNQTTAVSEGLVCNTSSGNFASNTVQPPCTIFGVQSPGGTPPPHRNHQNANRPEMGLILKWNRDGGSSNQWQDELGRNWNAMVRFDLPDEDVFRIDADANPPVESGLPFTGVGTSLFNMAVNPVSGKVYVSNTDAQNHVRFEGPGTLAAGVKPPGEPSSVQGHLAEARITVLSGSQASPRHLNKHIPYASLPAPAGVADDSLSMPLGMVVSPDGATLYVAAFGSGRIGVFDVTELESDTFTPSASDHIEVGGGPSGLVLQGTHLYVATRFDNSVSVVDLGSNAVIESHALHSPEPASVVAGRPFLYDARLTSSNGEAACASCHLFGDMDDLAWDLGNPDDDTAANTNPFNPLISPGNDPIPRTFHPMKGPMTTQSLRGLENMGPQHWRGDRQGDENAAFNAFNVAFPGLLGRAAELSSEQMQAFTDFALQLRYPPNPVRQLDNALRADEQAGANLYTGPTTDLISDCNGCHVLDASAGHFGGDGRTIFDGESQHFKIPHLRNMVQKVGMFGVAQPQIFSTFTLQGPFTHQGDQVRGYGYLHDGSIDTLFRFVGVSGFTLDDTEQDQLEAFMIAFDTDFAPIVGQQITLTATNGGGANPRIDLLIARSAASFVSKILGGTVTECDLTASVVLADAARGYLRQSNGLFLPDDAGPAISDAALRTFAATPGQEVTYTCVPPGSGQRVALDRDGDDLMNGVETGTGTFVGPLDTGTDPALADTDGDGHEDGLEVALGSDPTNPLSVPNLQVPGLGGAGSALLGALLLAFGAASAGARPRAARRPREPRS
jgi:DNA-binding beta-propeller fold protein YncE